MSEFIKLGNKIITKPQGCDYDLVPGKIYNLEYDDWQGSAFLTEAESLQLPTKVYQTATDITFKKRILTYFNGTENPNTGIMLAGEKGTGKSLQAKQLAIESGLPVLIVANDFPARRLLAFAKEFKTPVCFVLDEVEKNYRTEHLLDFLDGIESTCKKLVIMTCNDTNKISEYMQDRCSRIRYLRNYTSADNLDFLPELITDLGIENAEEVTKFIKDKFKVLSMDNIKSFLNEIKNFPELSLDEIIQFMNINTKN